MTASRQTTALTRTRGAVQIAGTLFDQLTARIHEFHRAIADKPFDRLQPLPAVSAGSKAVRTVHDPVTDGVYQTVRGVGALVFGAAGRALRLAERTLPAAPASPSRALDVTVGAVSGLVGDHMAATRNPLAIRAGFYRGGQRVVAARESLAGMFVPATPRLAVFVHGLCCTEGAWLLYRDQSLPYGESLQELGYTPLYFRYNSGVHVSQNGRTLARHLARLVAAWPVPVDEIVLVGHSMGGLVARSAAHAGREQAWADKVSQVVCLGTPHLGAPLEQAVNVAAAALEQYPMARPVARTLRARSLGIKDLRHGYVSDADWRRVDPNATEPRQAARIPRLPQARYHFIGAVVSEQPGHPMAEFLGDGLVRLASATARELADADTAVLCRTHHMRLLNHPQVAQWLLRHLAGSGTGPAIA